MEEKAEQKIVIFFMLLKKNGDSLFFDTFFELGKTFSSSLVASLTKLNQTHSFKRFFLEKKEKNKKNDNDDDD